MTPTPTSQTRSLPQRLVSWVPLPFWLTWVIVWFAIALFDLYITRGQTYSHITELTVTVFCATVIICVGLSTAILDRLHEDLLLSIDFDAEKFSQWYLKKMSWSYGGLMPVVAGIIYAVAVELSVGEGINSFSAGNDLALYFRMVYRLVGFFFIGVALWSFINIMVLPSQLMRFKFRLRIGDQSDVGLRGLGVVFFKLSMMAIVCFTIIVFNIMVSPIAGDPSVLGWIFSGAVLILCFFLVPQIAIHRMMASEKRRQMIYFSNHLEEALAKSIKEPVAENFQKLKELFELQSHLRKVSAWPFDMSALWQIVSALLIPLLLVLLQLALTGK